MIEEDWDDCPRMKREQPDQSIFPFEAIENGRWDFGDAILVSNQRLGSSDKACGNKARNRLGLDQRPAAAIICAKFQNFDFHNNKTF